MNNIAIFASGTGSNALKIIEYFKHSTTINVKLIVSNKKDATVLDKAHVFGIDTHVVERKAFNNSLDLLKVLKSYEINFIALAGFLWLIPDYLVQAYKGQIVNIHPALLPKYGGKGMYGNNVHKKVFEHKETYSGITIHHVDENYDEGGKIFQIKTKLDPSDSPEDIAQKVLKLEHKYYSRVIESILM